MRTAIDQRLLAQQTFEDAELEREVLAMFATQTPEILRALLAVAGPARAELAHRIKGSALAIGAVDLAAAASALESDPADQMCLQKVEQEVAAVIREIAHRRGGTVSTIP